MYGLEELRYRIALTRVPQIGCVQARILIGKFGSARNVFQARLSQLEHTDGIGKRRAAEIKNFTQFRDIEAEINFINKYGIRYLFPEDGEYPRRLLHCSDPPAVLFVKGRANLNTDKVVAIVGTRKPSDYGYQVTETLIQGLAEYQVTVISGLALGIDAYAHRMALKYHLPTIGVLAHGLEHLYPPQNKNLAREIIQSGGALLTEFTSREAPDKHHFPNRNRIVAGISDATIVIESGVKGGSMVTADLAHGYNREVFAVPGKITDSKSSGCLLLIKQFKSQLLTSADDLIRSLQWQLAPGTSKPAAPELQFPLTAQEQRILDELKEKASIAIDDLHRLTSLNPGDLSAALLNLEMQGLIQSLPGKQYRCPNGTPLAE